MTGGAGPLHELEHCAAMAAGEGKESYHFKNSFPKHRNIDIYNISIEMMCGVEYEYVDGMCLT